MSEELARKGVWSLMLASCVESAVYTRVSLWGGTLLKSVEGEWKKFKKRSKTELRVGAQSLSRRLEGPDPHRAAALRLRRSRAFTSHHPCCKGSYCPPSSPLCLSSMHCVHCVQHVAHTQSLHALVS